MPLALATSMYCAPVTRKVAWPFNELGAMVGALLRVAWVALLPNPDWSAHVVTCPLALLVTPTSAFNQSWRPAVTGKVCACRPVVVQRTRAQLRWRRMLVAVFFIGYFGWGFGVGSLRVWYPADGHPAVHLPELFHARRIPRGS